jgi:hypothetical protein
VFSIAALMTGAHYAGIGFYNGETIDWDPATMTLFRAHALRTAVLASGLYSGTIVLGLLLRT